MTAEVEQERSILLGKDRLYVSLVGGDRFVKLLEQKDPVWPILNQNTQKQLTDALNRFNNSGGLVITFVGEESEQAAAALFRIRGKLPPYLIGARVGETIEGRTMNNAYSILREIQLQLGYSTTIDGNPPELNMGMVNGLLAGKEEDTVVLILEFDKLPSDEQKELLKKLQHGKLSQCKKVICSQSPPGDNTNMIQLNHNVEF
jgi:hypothetical protein